MKLLTAQEIKSNNAFLNETYLEIDSIKSKLSKSVVMCVRL